MVFPLHAIGMSMCPGRAVMSWEGPSSKTRTYDYDGCLCLCFAFMPIVPIQSVHVFGHISKVGPDQYQQIPIRWSASLIVRVFAGRWLWGAAMMGFALTVIATLESWRGDVRDPGLVGAGMMVGAALVYWALIATDGRNLNLRRVMMSTPYRSSDPATWTAEMLESVDSPQRMFGVPAFQDAGRRAFEAREFGKAMLAARYAVALEGADESLTDEILAHRDVREALPSVHKDPERWPAAFG